MNENLDPFWQSTRAVRLTPEESEQLLAGIQLAMKNVSGASVSRRTDIMDTEHLFSSARHIHLSADEKSAVEEEILGYMRRNPVKITPDGGDAASGMRSDLEPFGTRLLFLLRPLTFLSGAMAVFVLCGAGVSAAADSALPGDFLYPFKVHVNEGVRGALRVTASSRAGYEAERLEMRLAEADVLRAEGRLSGETEKQVSGAVDAQMNVVSRAAIILEASGDADAAAQVKERAGMVLRRHERVLESLVETHGGLKVDVQNLLQNVIKAESQSSTSVSGTSISSVPGGSTSSSAQDMIDAAAKQIENQRKLLPQLPAGLRTDAELRLRNAARMNVQAQVGLASGKAAEALNAVRSAVGELKAMDALFRSSSAPHTGSSASSTTSVVSGATSSSVSMLPAAGNGSIDSSVASAMALSSMPPLPGSLEKE